MKTAIIVHGTPSKEEFLDPDQPSASNHHWLPWAQNQLLIRGYQTWTPEMPRPYAPDFRLWREEFEMYPIDQESLLVGHSCGAGFLLRWLSENRTRVKRLILVAPWLDPQGLKCPAFFRFEIDPKICERADVRIFVSDNDSSDINESVHKICGTFPSIVPKVFSGYGHFCVSDMGTDQFPELIEALLE